MNTKWTDEYRREYHRKRYHENIEAQRERGRLKYAKYREKFKLKGRERYQKYKQLVFKAYGDKCACCGESNVGFLTIDHVNSDGAKHRKQSKKDGGHGGRSTMIYTWAIHNNFPDTLQLLCYNCNCGRDKNGGTCPHL